MEELIDMPTITWLDTGNTTALEGRDHDLILQPLLMYPEYYSCKKLLNGEHNFEVVLALFYEHYVSWRTDFIDSGLLVCVLFCFRKGLFL